MPLRFPSSLHLHYFNGFLNERREIHGTCNDDELCFDRRDGSRRAAWCVGLDDIHDFRLDRMSSDSDDSFSIRAPGTSRSGSTSPDTFSLMTTGPFNSSEFAPSQVRLSINVPSGPRASLRYDVFCQNVARCSAEVPLGATRRYQCQCSFVILERGLLHAHIQAYRSLALQQLGVCVCVRA